jgi:hypothetical protein
MASTQFSGPIRSANGFQTVSVSSTTGAVTVTSTLGAATSVDSIEADSVTADTVAADTVAADSVTVADFIGMTAILTSELPPAAAGNAGQVRLISDNGAGDDEYCLVISTGAAWVTAVGAALS